MVTHIEALEAVAEAARRFRSYGCDCPGDSPDVHYGACEDLRYALAALDAAPSPEPAEPERTYTLPEAMPLLAKLASGEGGRRTGLLKRVGYLEWRVTEAGLEALKKAKGQP